MLTRLWIDNFYSVREPLELSLQVNHKVPDSFQVIPEVAGFRVSKVLALIGPNGSGKTTILKALAFLCWFAGTSFSERPNAKIPVQPHQLRRDEPTRLEVEFVLAGQAWRYRLELDSERVLHEALYKRSQGAERQRYVYLFKRDWNPSSSAYQVKVKPPFGLAQKEADKVRQNASLISTAAQYGSEIATRLATMQVETNLTEAGKYSLGGMDLALDAASFYHDATGVYERANQLLSAWDLGLTGTRVEEAQVADKEGKERTMYLPFGQHEVDGRRFELPLYAESGGTRTAFVLLSKLLPVLERGGLVVLDELEGDLHPHMLAAIVELFFSAATNPKHAQLIFSSHSLEILHQLNKEQVVLVEKDRSLGTTAYRLDDVEGVRADDNFYAKYLAGAYGAIPEL